MLRTCALTVPTARITSHNPANAGNSKCAGVPKQNGHVARVVLWQQMDLTRDAQTGSVAQQATLAVVRMLYGPDGHAGLDLLDDDQSICSLLVCAS